MAPSDGDAAAAAERERIARRLLALTREMRTFGEAGDWVGFAEREAERQELSRELFATPVPHDAAPVVADCVRRVLELDESLIELARAHRDEAARMLEESQRGRQAADAYRRFSR
ncbi:flagellar protein FliT [Arhodomonas aquaeolei]|uniref:flagellar protein FliT n=1 Tax=Arhodomonas TaxID=2368 RepID=UPI00036E5E6A|nr:MULTISPECIES: flagellar protein FliT [Arhodomonas]MCS4502800.1 flagellar protein FliT [Arhodomonas aquaeolei]